MKKMMIFLSSTILVIGVIMSLLKSANDNGLRAANLHENVLAQLNGSGDDTGGDDTGGGDTGGDDTGGDDTGGDKTGGDKTGGSDTGGSGNPNILVNGILDPQFREIKASSDASGTIHILGLHLANYKVHTEYVVTILSHLCKYVENCGNVCEYKMEYHEFIAACEKNP